MRLETLTLVLRLSGLYGSADGYFPVPKPQFSFHVAFVSLSSEGQPFPRKIGNMISPIHNSFPVHRRLFYQRTHLIFQIIDLTYHGFDERIGALQIANDLVLSVPLSRKRLSGAL